jgi:tetratricopeptide (TPR) repeat protein
MPEFRRSELPLSPDAGAPEDRASQIDALLVEGLDRYFAGRLEDAVHIWTRVLFLDRSHARARAYIERARTALAERQRHSEEMLQTSQDLLDRGQTDEARSLLSEAVAAAGDDERASALRLRLERLERVHAGASIHPHPPSVSAAEAIPGWSWPRRSPAVVVIATAIAAAVLLIGVISRPSVQQWLGVGGANEVLVASATPASLPVLSTSEVALVRARTLFARGRLAEALQALNRVQDDTPFRGEADALRVEIQRLLLASGHDRRGTGR